MLDVRTLYVVQFLILIAATIVMFQVYIINRKRFQGLFYWVLMMGLSTLGVLMIALRGIIPDQWSILLSNVFLYVSVMMIHVGMRKFFDAKTIDFLSLAIILCILFITVIFTFILPSFTGRVIILSIVYIFFSLRTIWFLYHHPKKDTRKHSTSIMITLGLVALTNLYRIVAHIVFPVETESIFENNPHEIIYFVLTVMAAFYLLFSMIMLVSKKLYVQIKNEQDKFNTLFHKSPNSVVITKLDTGEIVEVNQSMLNLLGYTRDEVIGKNIIASTSYVQQDLRESIVTQLRASGVVSGLELDLQSKDGQWIHTLYSAVVVDVNGQSHVLSTMEDITEMNTLKEKLHYMATHDFLTHLPNRDFFQNFFNDITESTAFKDQRVAIAMIDFDDFKNVNDDYGHDVGDCVLVQIAKKLEKSVYARGIATRLGGDEFALIITSGNTNLEPYLRKIHEELSLPMKIDDLEIQVHLSIGVTYYPEDGKQLDVLLKKSDMMLYSGKRSGKNKIVFSNE